MVVYCPPIEKVSRLFHLVCILHTQNILLDDILHLSPVTPVDYIRKLFVFLILLYAIFLKMSMVRLSKNPHKQGKFGIFDTKYTHLQINPITYHNQ